MHRAAERSISGDVTAHIYIFRPLMVSVTSSSLNLYCTPATLRNIGQLEKSGELLSGTTLRLGDAASVGGKSPFLLAPYV